MSESKTVDIVEEALIFVVSIHRRPKPQLSGELGNGAFRSSVPLPWVVD